MQLFSVAYLLNPNNGCSELRLWFQTSSLHLKRSGTLEKAIFGEIRARPQLATFLCGAMASLTVVLSAYDGHDSISMSWPDMMAFVAGYKNPLVALELLPPRIEATADAITEYLTEEENGGNTDVRGCTMLLLRRLRFTGPRLTGNFEPSAQDVGGIQRSKVDVDGGTHPNWNAEFVCAFEPSALTLQSVLVTDIHKLEIDRKMVCRLLQQHEVHELTHALLLCCNARNTSW